MKCSREEKHKRRQEAEKLRDSLTLEEKISLMSGNLTIRELVTSPRNLGGGYYRTAVFFAGGIPEKGIPSIGFCDGASGICGGKNHTNFPAVICRGAAFDRNLEKKIGRALGREVKAENGNLFAGICINLPYHPGWGRSQETYGEESWHIGEMASALIEGVNEENVIACIKHFAFNSMEFSRFQVDITCDDRTEREVFLPHFKKCIDHGAAAVMSAYNRYQGVWCGHHDYLINKVLKSEWKFDGVVMSDFALGIRDTIEAANGGMDIEMCAENLFGRPLLEAVLSGEVPRGRIDDAAFRIISTVLAIEKEREETNEDGTVNSKEHIALALQAAREGITLIQNNGVLPLDREKIHRVVVLGRLGNKENAGDHGFTWIDPEYIVTPLQGIVNAAQNMEVIYYEGKNLQHSRKLAESADAVIFVAGYDEEDEGEYIGVMDWSAGSEKDIKRPGDRSESLDLHPDEMNLLKTVGPVNKNSAVVLIGGGMIMTEEWKQSVGAIIMAYYPGMEGGTAIGEIIFGDVNPSGKLPFVIPQKEEDLPYVKWRTDHQKYEYYHGYAKLEKEGKEPAVYFGYGLSYTTFQLGNEKFWAEGDVISASCEIKNTGKYDGAEVIQMYIGFSNSKVDRPVKLLRGFERVYLKRNQTRTVKITCPVEEIKWFNPVSGQMELEHMIYEIFIGTSSCKDQLLEGRVEL